MKVFTDTFWEYNVWANRRLLAKATTLTETELNEKSPYLSDSILGAMTHLLGAEWLWRHRIQTGAEPARALTHDQVGTLELLIEWWEQEARAMQVYLAGLNETDLIRTIESRSKTGKIYRRTLWHVLFHVVNHGTQHRSEIAVCLTNLDRSPGAMDFLVFADERGL